MQQICFIQLIFFLSCTEKYKTLMIFKKRRRSQKEKIWSKVQSTNILAWPIARTSCPAHLWYFNYQCREYIRHHPVYRIRTSAWINFAFYLNKQKWFWMQKWGKGVKNETCINFQQILYDIYIKEVSMSILQSSTNGQSWLKWNKFGWYVNAVLFWTRRHANQSYYSLNKSKWYSQWKIFIADTA